MAFEFIGSAETVAKQQQIWGIALVVAGTGLTAFYSFKGKPVGYYLVALGLFVAAGIYFYQWWQLGSHTGEWLITSDEEEIRWQSPNEKIERSFVVHLRDIEYIDQSAMPNPSDHRHVFHLVLNNGAAFKLGRVSGIDLEQFVAHLESTGLESRQTDDYYLPTELRNK